MSTNLIVPIVTYTNISSDTPYNYNVPVASESEVGVKLLNVNGVDLVDSGDADYILFTAKSSGSTLFDISSVEITWVGLGVIPAVTTLVISRETSAAQITEFELGSDLAVATSSEVDRLTRSQQDYDSKFDALDIDNTQNKTDIGVLKVAVDLLSGELEVGNAVLYFGDKDTDGSFRIIKDGADLKIQVRAAAIWVTRDAINP